VVALSTAIILTFLAGMGVVIYRLLAIKVEEAVARMGLVSQDQRRIEQEQRDLRRDVDRVANHGVLTAVMAKSAVYAAQRVEELAVANRLDQRPASTDASPKKPRKPA
jgi:hypothetical protein